MKKVTLTLMLICLSTPLFAYDSDSEFSSNDENETSYDASQFSEQEIFRLIRKRDRSPSRLTDDEIDRLEAIDSALYQKNTLQQARGCRPLFIGTISASAFVLVCYLLQCCS